MPITGQLQRARSAVGGFSEKFSVEPEIIVVIPAAFKQYRNKRLSRSVVRGKVQQASDVVHFEFP